MKFDKFNAFKARKPKYLPDIERERIRKRWVVYLPEIDDQYAGWEIGMIVYGGRTDLYHHRKRLAVVTEAIEDEFAHRMIANGVKIIRPRPGRDDRAATIARIMVRR